MQLFVFYIPVKQIGICLSTVRLILLWDWQKIKSKNEKRNDLEPAGGFLFGEYSNRFRNVFSLEY